MNNLVKIALSGAILLSTSLYAQDEVVEARPLGWEGTGELGFVSTSGNTESTALNLKLNFIRTTERWRHRFTGTALMTSEDGDKDNERYTAEVQSDRKLSEKSWLFGSFRWDADKFGTYDPQLVFSAGYGRLLMQSENHQLKGEIGVGYRDLTERVSGDSSSDAIARFLLDDNWQVFATTAWSNRLLIETGKNNTFIQFNTGLTVSMTERFAVKLGFELRNNSEIPPGDAEHTDTITSANLVYNF
jgi:putative salt-induced outer membrane protein